MCFPPAIALRTVHILILLMLKAIINQYFYPTGTIEYLLPVALQ